MQRIVRLTLSAVCVWALVAGSAWAQRGVGDPVGLAQQAQRPEIVTLSGRLVEIHTGPCESTTGRAFVGTHLFLETPDGAKLNLHLGPAPAVARIVETLSMGQQLVVQAFRTEKMKEQHYVARLIAAGDAKFELRDENLRPAWAQGPGRGAWGGAGGGRGRGAGGGYGFGGGYGRRGR